VANRQQAALYREVAHPIARDVVSVADVDVAVRIGPRLCWGLMGSPGSTSPAVQRKIIDGVPEEVAGRAVETLSEERDALLIGLLELRAHHG
jgi:hypothetical protein